MRAKIAGSEMHYESFGSGRPILVLHGSGGNGRKMHGMVEPAFTYRSGWKRYYLDLPGHGSTPAPAWMSTQDQVLDQVLAFVDAVFKQEPFALIGGSWGGYLARGILAKRAEQVLGLCLIMPSMGTPFLAPQQGKAPKKAYLRTDADVLAVLDEVERPLAAGYTALDPMAIPDIQENLRLKGSSDADFNQRLWGGEGSALSVDVAQVPRSFAGPSAVIAGRQDEIVGYEDALVTLRQYHRGTFALLDRASHALPVEQARLLREIQDEWLRRLEESLGLFQSGGAS